MNRKDLLADLAMLVGEKEKTGMVDDLAPVLVARCLAARIESDITIEWSWVDHSGKWWENQAHGLRIGDDWLLAWIDTRPSGGQIEGQALVQIASVSDADEFLRELISDQQWGHEVQFLGTYYVQSAWGSEA